MDATRGLTGDIQAGQCLIALDALTVNGGLQAAHAIVDHRRDDGDIEWLGGHFASWDDVVVELLTAACLAAGLVPRLARGVGRPRATIGVLLGLLGGLVMLLGLIDERLKRYTHVLRQLGARLVVLHDATARVMLTMPHDFLR